MGTGGDAADTFAESDEDDDLDEEQRAALDAHPEREVVLTSAEQSKLLKIMGKMTSPGKFSGDKAEERDAVERWVDKATSYLDDLFGGIAAKRPQQYLDHVASLLEGLCIRLAEDDARHGPSGHLGRAASELRRARARRTGGERAVGSSRCSRWRWAEASAGTCCRWRASSSASASSCTRRPASTQR